MKTRGSEEKYVQAPTCESQSAHSTTAKVGGALRTRLLENHLYGEMRKEDKNAVLEAHCHKASPNMRPFFLISAIPLLSSLTFLCDYTFTKEN